MQQLKYNGLNVGGCPLNLSIRRMFGVRAFDHVVRRAVVPLLPILLSSEETPLFNAIYGGHERSRH